MRLCTFQGCENKHHARGLCRGHAQQLRRGGELKPIGKWQKRGDQPCGFAGCDRPLRARGYCVTHYAQSTRGKSGMHPIGERPSLTLDDLLADTEPQGDCLIYKPDRRAGNYPNTTYKGKQIGIHRLAWHLATGESVEGAHIHHKCANSRCVNPAHLERALAADNILEMLARKDYEARIEYLEEQVKMLEQRVFDLEMGLQ